jgi:conserved oligomeric Golgi complex subunit 6
VQKFVAKLRGFSLPLTYKYIHQTEAGMVHSQELQALRAESHAVVEQLRTAHRSTIDDIKAEHANILESQVKESEKKFSNQAIELKATQDDLLKAKTSRDGALLEVENLKTQLEDARKAHADLLANPPPGQIEEIERLRQELTSSHDERAALRESLALTKSSMEETILNHNKDLEEAAKGRAEQVARLSTHHDEEMKALTAQKSELLVKLSDLEGELYTLKASIEAESSNPKTNGAAHIPSPGVSELELQQMHQAHNLKMHDLQAEHERARKAAEEELQQALAQLEELKQDIERKEMEIALFEQDQDEKDDKIAQCVVFTFIRNYPNFFF